MANFSKGTKGAPVVHIWDELLTHTDGLGGATLDISELDKSIGTGYVDKGCPLYVDFSARTAHVVKAGEVVSGSTTTKTRIKKNHLFKVGDPFGKTGGTGVTITAIDTTTSTEYDILTHLTNGGALSEGDIVVNTEATGADAVEKYTANCVMLDTTFIETGVNVPCVYKIDQWVEKARFTYALSDATIAALSPNIIIK